MAQVEASIVEDCLEEVRSTCQELEILIIGETGVGKSTLVNNLLGIDEAAEGDTIESATSTVQPFRSTVNGVPVCIYDTPGLGDSREERDDLYLSQLKPIVNQVHLTICCIKMNESRMHEGMLDMLKKYNKIGINWEKTIFALTFADALTPPSSVRKAADFNIKAYFNSRLQEWRKYIMTFLARKARISREKLSKVKINPTTDDCEAKLLNDEHWFTPFWLDVLRVLPPGPMVRFLEIFTNNSPASEKDQTIKCESFHQPDSRLQSIPSSTEKDLLPPSPGAEDLLLQSAPQQLPQVEASMFFVSKSSDTQHLIPPSQKLRLEGEYQEEAASIIIETLKNFAFRATTGAQKLGKALLNKLGFKVDQL